MRQPKTTGAAPGSQAPKPVEASAPPTARSTPEDWAVTDTYIANLDRGGLFRRLREFARPLGVNAHNPSALRTALDEVADSTLRAVDLQRLAKRDEAVYVMETESILAALREQAKKREEYKEVCGSRPSREVVESFLVGVLGNEQAKAIIERRRQLHDAVRECDALVEELRGRRRSLETILRSLIS